MLIKDALFYAIKTKLIGFFVVKDKNGSNGCLIFSYGTSIIQFYQKVQQTIVSQTLVRGLTYAHIFVETVHL